METVSVNKKYRWYETMEKVVIEVPAKNVTDEKMFAKFEPDTLSLTVYCGDDGIYSLTLNLLNAVVPDLCSHKIRGSKIELHLPKKMHSYWGKLEREPTPRSKLCKPSKNWDQVVRGLMTADDEFGDSSDEVFENIFKMGDADQQRAMMKSYTESNGTVLNMNWDEVSRKKVDVYSSESESTERMW